MTKPNLIVKASQQQIRARMNVENLLTPTPSLDDSPAGQIVISSSAAASTIGIWGDSHPHSVRGEAREASIRSSAPAQSRGIASSVPPSAPIDSIQSGVREEQARVFGVARPGFVAINHGDAGHKAVKWQHDPSTQQFRPQLESGLISRPVHAEHQTQRGVETNGQAILSIAPNLAPIPAPRGGQITQPVFAAHLTQRSHATNNGQATSSIPPNLAPIPAPHGLDRGHMTQPVHAEHQRSGPSQEQAIPSIPPAPLRPNLSVSNWDSAKWGPFNEEPSDDLIWKLLCPHTDERNPAALFSDLAMDMSDFLEEEVPQATAAQLETAPDSPVLPTGDLDIIQPHLLHMGYYHFNQ